MQADHEPVSFPSTSALQLLQLLQLLGKSSHLSEGEPGAFRGRAAAGGLSQPSSAGWSCGGGKFTVSSSSSGRGSQALSKILSKLPLGHIPAWGPWDQWLMGRVAIFRICELEKVALRIILGIVRKELLQVQIREAIKSKTMHPARSGLGDTSLESATTERRVLSR